MYKDFFVELIYLKLDYLVELGIFTNRRDGRIDAGDLYLRGLHLKRKGGVARPKKVGVN